MAKNEAASTYTDAELLALTREAIANLTAGAQRYRIGGREFQAADLDKLWKQVEMLEARIARASSGGLGWRNVKFKRRTDSTDN